MAKSARRRRNPKGDLLPWILGGVAVASVGFVLYEQQQANAAQQKANAALAAQQSQDAAALASQQQQASAAALAAQQQATAALAAQQSQDAAALAAAQAQAAKPAPPAVTSLNYQVAIDVLDKLSIFSGHTPATILALCRDLDSALQGLLAADEAAIGGQVWYNQLQSQRTVLQLTPAAFNASVFGAAAQQGKATLTGMKANFDAGQR